MEVKEYIQNYDGGDLLINVNLEDRETDEGITLRFFLG